MRRDCPQAQSGGSLVKYKGCLGAKTVGGGRGYADVAAIMAATAAAPQKVHEITDPTERQILSVKFSNQVASAHPELTPCGASRSRRNSQFKHTDGTLCRRGRHSRASCHAPQAHRTSLKHRRATLGWGSEHPQRQPKISSCGELQKTGTEPRGGDGMPMVAAAAFMAATSSRVAKRPCGCVGQASCERSLWEHSSRCRIEVSTACDIRHSLEQAGNAAAVRRHCPSIIPSRLDLRSHCGAP